MFRYLLLEIRKVKRTPVFLFALLGPMGLLFIQFLNYSYRYDYMMKKSIEYFNGDLWVGLILETHCLLTITMIIGIAILTSILCNAEHQGSMFKYLFSLPIKKYNIYLYKFFLISLLLLVSVTIYVLGLIGIGFHFNFGKIPIKLILSEGFFPFISSLCIIAFQLIISININTQAICMFIGIASAVLSCFFAKTISFLPWAYPTLSCPIQNRSLISTIFKMQPYKYMYLSLLLCFCFISIGMYIFYTKETN